MSKKSKTQKKSSGKPVKARDAKPAWLDNPKTKPVEPEKLPDSPAFRYRPYEQYEDWEKREARAMEASEWLRCFDDLKDVTEELDELLNPEIAEKEYEGRWEEEVWYEKSKEVWLPESTETLVQQVEKLVVSRVKEEGWLRSKLEDGAVFWSSPDWKIDLKAEGADFIRQFMRISNEPRTPLDQELCSMNLAPHSPEIYEHLERVWKILKEKWAIEAEEYKNFMKSKGAK
jgi:hypothetical protein